MGLFYILVLNRLCCIIAHLTLVLIFKKFSLLSVNSLNYCYALLDSQLADGIAQIIGFNDSVKVPVRLFVLRFKQV